MALTTIPVELVTLDDGVTISTADNDAQLILVSTDADANIAPLMQFYRNSSSPADNDQTGRIEFKGRNDNSQDVNYATIVSQILDASDGSEDGRFAINTMVAGTSQSRIDIRASETVINNESIDVDFRVESDANANMFFVDAGNSAIGVGTTPNSGWSAASTSGRVPIQIGAGSISGRLNDNHTEFSNNCYASGTGNDPQWSGMSRYAKQQIEFDSNGQIIFKNAPTVDQTTFDSSPNFSFTNIMVLDANGKVGIGAGSSGDDLHVSNLSTSCNIRASGENNVNRKVQIGYDASAGPYVQAGSSGINTLKFYVDNTSLAMTIAANDVISGDFNDTSDVALKENIIDLESATEKLKQLKPRIFDWKNPDKQKGVGGFIAQEVETVIPKAVVGNDYVADTYYTDGDTIPDGKEIGDLKTAGDPGKAVNTSAILAYAVKAIQELEAKVKALEEA